MARYNRKALEAGARFGAWVVLREDGREASSGAIVYRCRCDCGREQRVPGTALRIGNTRVCSVCSRARTNAARARRNDRTRRAVSPEYLEPIGTFDFERELS